MLIPAAENSGPARHYPLKPFSTLERIQHDLKDDLSLNGHAALATVGMKKNVSCESELWGVERENAILGPNL